jgi:hypothetical protein
MNKYYLEPHKIKFVGLVLFIAGLFLAFLRFYLNLKPDFLEIKTFAFYSIYLETRIFEQIKNNFFDEIIIITSVLGQYLIIYSLIKNLTEEDYKTFRKSFLLAITINTIFILITTLTFYGIAFIYLMIINLFLFNVTFIISFQIMVRFKSKIIKEL